MAKRKRSKWPKRIALTLLTVMLTGSLALVLVEKFAPDQTYIPQSIVEIPSRIVAAALQPMQSAFGWATNGISGYLQNWKLRKNIEIEYNKLRAQNEELVYASMYNDELEEKIKRLEDLYDTKLEYRELNPVLANVTQKETGNWFQMFTIDKGERDGVKTEMAVINERGLIGYISKVYETSSEVISIIDSRAGISGIINSTRDQGVVRGTLGIVDEPTCRMYYLPVDLVPRPGDTVVTSGIGMPFPKGIVIGDIRESTKYMDENKQYVVIEPRVDFQHIEEVLVLVYETPEEETPEGNDGQIDYVPSVLDTPRPSPSIGGNVLEDPELGAVTPPPRVLREGSEETDVLTTGSPDPQGSQAPQGTQAPQATATPQLVFGVGSATATPDPDATPTPNPELDALMQEERAQDAQQEDG